MTHFAGPRNHFRRFKTWADLTLLIPEQLEVLTHWHVGFFSIPAGQVPARFEFKVEWVASDTLDSRYSILMFQHYLHMGNHTN